MYKLIYSPLAMKDAKKIMQSYLRGKCEELLDIISKDPYVTYPPYERLSKDLSGYFARRINLQHRLVYEVDEALRVIKVHRMWSHYE